MPPPATASHGAAALRQDEAQALYRRRAFWLLAALPRGSYVSLDQHEFQTDAQFGGFKLVPPGLHCLTWQAASYRDERYDALAQEGLRSACFLYINGGEVVSRTYDPATDTFAAPDGAAEALASDDYVRAMDHQLAAYPNEGLKAWLGLTAWLRESPATVARVFQQSGGSDATCDSFTPLVGAAAAVTNTDAPDARMHALQFTPFVLSRSWPPDAQGAERTRWRMDKTWLLHDVLRRAGDADQQAGAAAPLLREAELSFLLFRYVNHASALEHWLALGSLFCHAAAQLGAPAPYELHPCEWDEVRPGSASACDTHVAWMQMLARQWHALPDTIWREELADYEVRVLEDLAALRANIARGLGASAARGESAAPVHERLVQAWRALSAAAQRFGWELDHVLDEEWEASEDVGEDAPVIVELP